MMRYKTKEGWVGDSELDLFQKACDGPIVVSATLAEGVRIDKGWVGSIPGIGSVKLTGNGEVYFGRSLSKVHQEIIEGVKADEADNGRVLTVSECNNALPAWSELAENALPFIDPDTWEVRRADIVFDRQVGNTMHVMQSLLGGVKPTRKGSAWFDNGKGVPTGVMFRGRAVVHRCYDKGLESGHKEYNGVLRSEEQLRAGSRGLLRIVNGRDRAMDREACREVLNERYLDVGYGEAIDIAHLLRRGEDLTALLVLHPEYMEVYRGRVKESAYYKMKRKVREVRAAAIPADLRVPEDAWLDKAA